MVRVFGDCGHEQCSQCTFNEKQSQTIELRVKRFEFIQDNKFAL